MFGKRNESQGSDYKSGQSGSEGQDRVPVLGLNQAVPGTVKPYVRGAKPSLVRESGPVPLKPTLVREGSVPVSTEPSIIREGFEFVGDMKAAGSLTVDGAIKGNLAVQSLSIGVSGLVDGSVTADSIHVEGCLSGTVECKDFVIGSRAVVDGKLSYNTISIQRGGTIKGDLKRA